MVSCNSWKEYRNISLSGLSLQTRFNSTIRVDPPYPQALELNNWAKTNKDMLLSYASDSISSGSSSHLIVTPSSQQVISISEISSQTSIGVFTIEAEKSISDDLQQFCVLECSGCKQKKLMKDKRGFDCARCQQPTELVPCCIFQIDLIDGSGSTSALISGELAEEMLTITAEDIFDITCIKEQLLPVSRVHQML